MELERMLLDLGVSVVDTLPSAELATASLKSNTYDCGVLDINLGEGTSFTVAEQLVDRKTAVVLTSGYDSNYELPPSLSGVPRLTKPVGRLELIHAIRNAVELSRL
jgi:DNA-binding NarL/FixJ family response regulator